MRAKTDIIDIHGGKKAIIVNEIPYMVNKARLIEKMAEHVKEKRILLLPWMILHLNCSAGEQRPLHWIRFLTA